MSPAISFILSAFIYQSDGNNYHLCSNHKGERSPCQGAIFGDVVRHTVGERTLRLVPSVRHLRSYRNFIAVRAAVRLPAPSPGRLMRVRGCPEWWTPDHRGTSQAQNPTLRRGAATNELAELRQRYGVGQRFSAETSRVFLPDQTARLRSSSPRIEASADRRCSTSSSWT
jgi:hypothetical protein